MKFLGKEPKIYINTIAMAKMKSYVKNSEKQIAWVLEIDYLQDESYLINDVFLIDQKVGYADVKLNKDSYAELLASVANSTEKEAIFYDYCGLGRSKVNSTVVPDKTDEKMFNDILGQMAWYICIQMNKKGEINIWYMDMEHQIVFDNLKYEIFTDLDYDQDVNDEIKKYVTDDYSYATTGKSSTSSYTTTSYTPVVKREPSELVNTNPPISKIV